MKMISRISLVLSIVSVCVGAAMIVLTAITATKFTARKIDRI